MNDGIRSDIRPRYVSETGRQYGRISYLIFWDNDEDRVTLGVDRNTNNIFHIIIRTKDDVEYESTIADILEFGKSMGAIIHVSRKYVDGAITIPQITLIYGRKMIVFHIMPYTNGDR